MIRKILCAMGFHRWDVAIKRRYYVDKVCHECGQGIIKFNFKKDE